MDTIIFVVSRAYWNDIELVLMISKVILYGLSNDAIIILNWYVGCIIFRSMQ